MFQEFRRQHRLERKRVQFVKAENEMINNHLSEP